MNLKAIKKRLLNKERALKQIRVIYSHLVSMSDEELMEYLDIKDDKELFEYIKDLFISKEPNKKSLIKKCRYTDNSGRAKNLYSSEREAKRVAEYIYNTQKILLKIYPCPDVYGWHLSKI